MLKLIVILLCLFFKLCCSKNSQRAIDELQRTVVDVETKYKAELNRLRKKHDQQLVEYETQIDTLTRSNGELARANKALAARVKVYSSDCYYVPARSEGGSKLCFCASVCPSVCPSVAYIANNSRTQRPSMPKFGMKVSHL